MKNKVKVLYGSRMVNINETLWRKNQSLITGYLGMAEMVNDWASSVNNPYLLGDILLCKLNIIDKRQIRKNKYFKVKNERY